MWALLWGGSSDSGRACRDHFQASTLAPFAYFSTNDRKKNIGIDLHQW